MIDREHKERIAKTRFYDMILLSLLFSSVLTAGLFFLLNKIGVDFNDSLIFTIIIILLGLGSVVFLGIFNFGMLHNKICSSNAPWLIFDVIIVITSFLFLPEVGYVIIVSNLIFYITQIRINTKLSRYRKI